MKFFTQISNILSTSEDQITEETILYYEKNPDELELIKNREHFNVIYLRFIFALGILITVLARVVAYYCGSFLGDFVKSVVTDVISELGIAIFGGAICAYLIEILNKQQYQKNIKLWRELKAILKERQLKKGQN